MRGKEEAHDYRYFPDPDLPPLRLDPEWVRGIREALPELPVPRFERFRDVLGLSPYHADVLFRDPELADYFEEGLRCGAPCQELANWVINAILEEKNARGVGAREVGLSPTRLAELLRAIDGGKVSRQKARDVFKAMLGNDRGVGEVIRSLGLAQISDDAPLRRAVEDVIAANPAAADDVRQGKKKSLNFLMGQAMRATKGQGNPAVIARLIEELLPPAGGTPAPGA